MTKYQQYAEYKDSGIEWLGEVPKHWIVVKLGNFVFMQEGPGLRTWQFTDSGIRVICVTNITENGINFSKLEKFISTSEYLGNYRHFTVNKGDILLSSSGNSWGKVASYLEDEVVILNTSTIRLNESANKKIIIEFIKYILSSFSTKEQLGLMMTGSCQPNFGPSHLKEVKVVLPSQQEQYLIVNFLDYETSKIDSLIEKQQQLIELLKEKRQAVISHAVTKGLNPDVSMKDSGVEWLGKVPEHWSVTKIGFHALKIGSGKTPKGGAEIYQDEGVLFIRSQNVYNDGLRIDNSESVYISEAIHDDMSTSKVYSGDILLNITGGSIGRSSLVPDNFPEANVNQHVCIIRVRKYLQEFLALVIQSDLIQAQLRSIQTGGNREGLNFEQISKFWFVLPSEEDQIKIISYIRNKLDEFSELEAKANKAIQLMQERRTALISSAVTGKIDVRNWQNPTEARMEFSA